MVRYTVTYYRIYPNVKGHQMRNIYVRDEFCIGCHLCEVYCQLEHSQSRDLVKAYKREYPRPVPRLRVEGTAPGCFAVPCRHCPEPACVYACLTGALHKDSHSGVVTIDSEKCIGCWTCVLACPFGAITQNTEVRKAAKCDLCPEEDIPACVANCPNEALVYAEDEQVILARG